MFEDLSEENLPGLLERIEKSDEFDFDLILTDEIVRYDGLHRSIMKSGNTLNCDKCQRALNFWISYVQPALKAKAGLLGLRYSDEESRIRSAQNPPIRR